MSDPKFKIGDRAEGRGNVSTSEFTRGFYCAVAALIKMHGADTESRELAHLGGDLLDADQEDKQTITRAFPEFAHKNEVTES